MENAEDADDEEDTDGGDNVEDTNDEDDVDDTDNVGARDSEHNEQDFELGATTQPQNADRASKPAPAFTTRASCINHSQSPPSG